MSSGKVRIEIPDWIWWSIVFLVITSLVVAIFAWIGHVPHEDNRTPEEAGQLGDSYGFANSLFSALAFSGVIVTLIMQITELKHQREELTASRRSHQEIAMLNLVASYLSAMEAIQNLRPVDTERFDLDEAKEFNRKIRNIDSILDYFEPLIASLLMPQEQARGQIRLILYSIQQLLLAHKIGSLAPQTLEMWEYGTNSMKLVATVCNSKEASDFSPIDVRSIAARLTDASTLSFTPIMHGFALSAEVSDKLSILEDVLTRHEKHICQLFVIKYRARKQ